MKSVGDVLSVAGVVIGLWMLMSFVVSPYLWVKFWFWCLDENHRVLVYVPSAVPLMLTIAGWLVDRVTKPRTR